MYTRRSMILLAVSTVIVLMLAAFASPARDVLKNGQSGGFVSLPWGTFTDPTTGDEYGLTVIAREADDAAGVGKFTLQLLGPGISVCSTHGGGVDIGLSENGEDFAGNYPLQEIQCGTAYSMAVSVDGCTAKTELHGYSHSDYPLIIYTGSNTVELTLRKTAAESSKVSLKVFTPKGPIKLSGDVSGPVEMDTCP